jgi:hypothetical protein
MYKGTHDAARRKRPEIHQIAHRMLYRCVRRASCSRVGCGAQRAPQPVSELDAIPPNVITSICTVGRRVNVRNA